MGDDSDAVVQEWLKTPQVVRWLQAPIFLHKQVQTRCGST